MRRAVHIARRLAAAASTMLAVSLLMFVLVMSGPNPLAQLGQESDVDVASLSAQYGLDRSWHEQYAAWLDDIVHGDLGTSVRTNEPARAMVVDRVPITVGLGLASTLISLVLAIGLGTWAAIAKDSSKDRLSTGAMVAISAVPSFMLALVLQWLAVQLRDLTGHTIFYVGGMPREPGLLEGIQRFTIPVMVLSLVQVAAWMRFQRAELIEVLSRDFVGAARAKGLPERVVLLRHALRCALVPMITIVALDLGSTIGGAVIVETIFGLPGLGRLLVDSIQARDVVVTLDIVVIAAAAIVAATALADALVARADPRIAID